MHLILIFILTIGWTLGEVKINSINETQWKSDRPGDYNELNFSQRIVGGRTTSISEVPYTVALLHKKSSICGGSILSQFIVVSAAHCFRYGTKPTYIRAGSSLNLEGGQLANVAKYILHETFNTKHGYDNDISLVFLDRDLMFNYNVLPVRLPMQNQPVPVGSYGLISGWGHVSENKKSRVTLQSVFVPILPYHICRMSLKNSDSEEVTENMFCAGFLEGGKDACQGDSGGPLVVRGVLIGITSWGIGCGRYGKPGVYTKISNYINWIYAHVY